MLDALNTLVRAGVDVETVAGSAGLAELRRVNYERETCDTAIQYRAADGQLITGWITRNCDGSARGLDGFDRETHPFE
jgi:hypothetical protein